MALLNERGIILLVGKGIDKIDEAENLFYHSIYGSKRQCLQKHRRLYYCAGGIRIGREITSKGLVIMDTPGNDTASLCAMAAGGAVISIFSSGRGTPVGNPIMPVIKITGNHNTYEKMKCNIDFDASPVMTGALTARQSGEKLFQITGEVINGRRTKAELLGMNEIAIARYCNFT